MYISGLVKILVLALVGADMAAAYACSNAGPASVCVRPPPDCMHVLPRLFLDLAFAHRAISYRPRKQPA